uniref:Transcriptional regulator MarR family n=1 Tax=uncultured bacterium contig00017 TaxID=1181508 RepID=A0A806KAM9_9BACT|nr:transcriptional regulator MarR family [uncultured bacterium contig00017]
MKAKKKENGPLYISEAVSALEEIMSNNHMNIFAHMTKATRGESFVLRFLAQRDGAVLPSELKTALKSSKPRISAILRTLEKKGEIVREVDKANRRNVLVTITETGRARAKTDMQRVYDCIAETFAEMGETDTRDFIRLARKVFGAVQKMD